MGANQNPYTYQSTADGSVNQLSPEDIDHLMTAPDPPTILPPQQLSSEDIDKQMGLVQPEAATATPKKTYIQQVQDHFGFGAAEMDQGYSGFQYILGLQKYEDVERDYGNAQIAAKKKAGGYDSSKLGTWDVQHISNSFAEMAPFIGETIKWGGGGAVLGAGAGFVTGGRGGAAVGALGGPEAEAPVAAAGAAVGTIGGALQGFNAGSGVGAAVIFSGQTAVRLKEMGVSDQNAKAYGLAGGVAMGLATALQLKLLSGVGRQAAIAALRTPAGRMAANAFAVKFITRMGGAAVLTQTGFQAQTVTGYATEILAKMDDGGKASWDWNEMQKRMVETYHDTAALSIALPLAADVAGHGTATTVEGIRKSAEIKDAQNADIMAQKGTENAMVLSKKMAEGKMSIKDAFDVLKEGMSKPPPATQAEIDAIKSKSVEETLDQLAKPVIGEDGQVTAESTGKVGVDESGQPQLKISIQENKQVEETPKKGGTADGEEIQTTEKTQQTEKVIPAEVAAGVKSLPSPEMKARVAKIDTDVSVLEKDIHEAEAEKAQREADNRPTDAIDNKLAKLYNQYENLDTERAHIEHGHLTPEDIAKAKITLTSGKVTHLRAKAVAKIIEGFQKGIAKGERLTKSAISKVQTAVAQVIRRSGLEPENKAKFLTELKNIQTVDQLEKALPTIKAKIETLAESENQKHELRTLKRLLKQTDLKKGSKHPVGKFTADIQRTLNLIKEAIANPNFQQKVSDEMYTKSQKGQPFSQDDYIRAAVAEHYANVKDKSAADLAQMNDELSGLMQGGRAENLEKAVARQEAIDQSRIAVRDSIQGKRPTATKYESDINSTKRGPKALWKNTRQFLRTWLHYAKAWDKLLGLVGQDDPLIAKGQKPAIVSELTHNAAHEKQQAIYQEWSKNLDARVRKGFGIENRNKFVDKAAELRNKVALGEPVWADGQKRPLTLSGWDGIKLYMEMKDPSLRASLEEGNEYTFKDTHGDESVQAHVEKFIGPEGMEVGDSLLKHFREFYTDVANPYWRDTRGVDLPFNDFYSPIRRRVEGSTESMSPFDMIQKSTIPISARSRTNNIHPIAPQNALLAATKHLNDWAHFISHEEWNRKVEATLKNPETRYIIEGKYGKGVLRDLDFLHDVLMGRDPRATVVKPFDQAFSRASIALVAFKWASFPRHVLPILGYLYHVEPHELVGSMADALAHPKKVIKTLNQSATIRDKFSGWEREFIEVAQAPESRKFILGKTLTDWFMLPVTSSSAIEKYGGAWAVYQKVLKTTKSPEKALEAAVAATKELSFGGGVDTRSALQVQHPLATKFGTILFKHSAVMTEAIGNMFNHPTPEMAHKALKAAAVIGITLPVMDTIITTRLGQSKDIDNADREINSAVTGLMGLHLPMIQDVVDNILMESYNVLAGHKDRIGEPDTLLGTSAKNLWELAKASLEMAADPDLETTMRTVHYGSRLGFFLPTWAGGELPLPTIDRIIEGMLGVDIYKKQKTYSNTSGSGSAKKKGVYSNE